MPHDHFTQSPPPAAAGDAYSPFAAPAWLRLALAGAAAATVWLAVAWALGWWQW